MRGGGAEVDEGLALLRDSVVDRLSAQGWVGRDLTAGNAAAVLRTVATVTRPGDNGVLVAVEIVRRSFSWPSRWPVDVETRIGVGYEPALNLMPLLTLPARPSLIDDPADGGSWFRLSLARPGDVVPAADRIVEWVQQRSPGLVARFPDAEAIEAELERQTSANTEDGGLPLRDAGGQELLVLLAAMGRHDQAGTLLTAYEAETEAEAGDGPAEARAAAADRRFLRQLRRWLERGDPPAPPVEETLAILAAPPPEPPPARGQILATVRARAKVRRQARTATRAQAEGKNLEQLKTLVATEYSARGIQLPPSATAWHAQMLQIEQRPFGRVRSTLKGLKLGAVASGDAIRIIRRGRVPTDPDSLRPPQRASYPVRGSRSEQISVEMDPAARTWLDSARADATRRLGPWALVDVWLAHDQPTNQLVVHIGDHRVGTIRPEDTHRFDRVMAAAALFDEDPVLEAALIPADGTDSTPRLELAIPRDTQTPESPSH